MDADLKTVLLELVADLQDLRVNQVLLAARVGTGVSPAVAHDAKNLTTTEIAKQYAGLQKRIEESK